MHAAWPASDRERERRPGGVGRRRIGLAWTNVYETLDTVTPGSFRSPQYRPERPACSVDVYVSLPWPRWGYGDVTPATPLAGTLAWREAVTGQLYLASRSPSWWRCR
jgi:hypothetical protein